MLPRLANPLLDLGLIVGGSDAGTIRARFALPLGITAAATRMALAAEAAALRAANIRVAPAAVNFLVVLDAGTLGFVGFWRA